MKLKNLISGVCAIFSFAATAEIKYAISYDYGAGTGPATANQETYVISTEDQTIHLTAPTPALGYDFSGFTLKETRDGVTFNDKTNMVIAANAVDPISVKANYQVITYTISYKMDGGTVPMGSPTSYTVNDPINVGDEAIKEGHDFVGWTWEGQSTPKKNVSIPVGHVGNITFTAHWEIRKYIQAFFKNIDADVANLPEAKYVPWNTKMDKPTPDPSCEGYRFDGWYQDGACTRAFDFTQPIKVGHFIYAKWVELPDVPVDGDLDDNGRKNAAALVDAIMKAGVDVNNWVESVYGTSGKIPAAKLNATTSANVALAVANDIPVTVNEPTFAVSVSMVTAESGNVAAFEFTLMDGGDPVEIKNLTQRVKAMVRYTSTLGVAEFAQATEVQAEVGLTATGGKIKAEFKKQTGVNAGFMKAEPQPAR